MRHFRNAHTKIVIRESLLAEYRMPRNGVLVFTNGVFDILHRGHVEYLNAARMLGDVLVVALNTDASARRLGKGPDRPINCERDRAIVVAALECVDRVICFDDDTPQSIIADLVPDVLVKGGDYTPDTVIGRSEVEAAGGKVVVIPLIKGRSTSETLRKMRETP